MFRLIKKYQNIIAISFLLIFFLFVATYDIGKNFPPGLNHDAAWNGLYSLRILNGERFTVYTSEAYGQETLFHYVMAAFFYLFGVSKETIELTSSLFGLISIPFIYYLTLYFIKDKLYAFLLSLMFISSSAFILYSRAGWRLITLIPFVAAVMLLSYLYTSYKKTKYAFWLGISSALTLYTYNGGRAIVIYFLLFWAVILFESKKRLSDFLYSFLTFITISLPILIFAIPNMQIFFGRAQSLYHGITLSSFLTNLTTALLYFNVNAGGNDFFTNFPVLEGPISILWILGFFVAILKFRKYWIVLCLFILLLIPSIVTTPSFHRAIGTLPIVYFLGFIPIFEVGKKYLNKRKAVLVLLLILVSLQSYSSLTKLYVKKLPFSWGFYPEATKIGKYLKSINRKNDVVIYANNWPVDILTFMSLIDNRSTSSWFKNYQSYNTLSKDGISEIIDDLSKDRINSGATFIVDSSKSYFFVFNIKKLGLNPLNIGSITYMGRDIAYIYKL